MNEEENDVLICDFLENSEESDFLLALHLHELDSVFNNECENDRLLALELDKQLNERNEIEYDDCFTVNGVKYKSLVDPRLEIIDPQPDIWHLFRLFDKQFFRSILTRNSVEVLWSPKMTHCAGLCQWSARMRLCSVRLSEPLLKLRPRSDFIETLLHEMIHAFLFVTNERDGHQSHGPVFHRHMYRINKEAGTRITVYHSFHDEVNHYRTHVWRCEGPCRSRAPFFGYVKRSMNRKPGPTDFWWKSHLDSCGGTFIKISEPEKQPKPSKSVTKKVSSHDIRDFIPKNSDKPSVNNVRGVKRKDNEQNTNSFVPFSGKGFKLGEKTVQNVNKCDSKKLKSANTATPSTVATSKQEEDVLISSFYENTEDDYLLAVSLDEFEKNASVFVGHKSGSQINSKPKPNSAFHNVIELD